VKGTVGSVITDKSSNTINGDANYKCWINSL